MKAARDVVEAWCDVDADADVRMLLAYLATLPLGRCTAISDAGGYQCSLPAVQHDRILHIALAFQGPVRLITWPVTA